MTSTLFNFPKQAYFGRVIPKTKFYEHGSLTRKLKDLFVKQVEQIVWLYKLAPETINLPSTEGVPELQVFKVVLKGVDLGDDVLRCIDQAVMFPVLFEVESGDKVRLVAAYKRKSNSADGKWVLTDYYSTEWLAVDSQRVDLQYSLSLASIYEQVLQALSPIEPRRGEGVDALFERNEEFKKNTNELMKIESKLKQEKQFNKRVELNASLREIKNLIEQLTA
ncbi:DUF4391 domain-containing protein [Ferrovum sp. PN-J185]|uniref:DUF4391 domain-containing protein n=1 Tax=Ferrovum sp. PN-J185 TaxID=1356306 RepID=UPI00079B3925|nr:DUF4391 domain-containing protein [Ferrovum sp. PN-J185]KXW56622.1 hypothetical protein FV185_05770 [Ferrovum sp. PN-J185]